MSARTLFIGLDAAESQWLEAGLADGRLPNLAALAERGATAPLDNCMRTLPGAVWPEIASGVSCGRLPRFFHPRQVVTGSAAPRALRADDVIDDPTVWGIAGEQGRRVAVVDIPHTPLARTFNGMQVVEYGLHDSHFGSASHPAALFAELRERHGAYPVASCDHYGGSRADHQRLRVDLIAGLERKTRLLLDVLGRERWDLFACAFSESHCVGHWFWHYADAAHWAHVPDAPPELRDAVWTIYTQLDTAIGRLVAAADADTTIVLASHGMAPYVAGYQMLPEFLARLGYSSGAATPRSWLRDLQHAAKHWIPRRHWERLGRLTVENAAVRTLLRPLQRSSGAMFFPLESADTRAVYVPNNTIGAIRLNLRGREPFGCIEPGDDAHRVMQALREALRELVQPSSGEPIVEDVVSADEAFEPDHHPDVPDLIVRFRQDLGLLDTCESPRVGRIHVPVGSRWGRRSGDHSVRSRVWLASTAGAAPTLRTDGTLLDIAPTILATLGCHVPAPLEGCTLVDGGGG